MQAADETSRPDYRRALAFVAELAKHGLLIDGEITIQPEGSAQPFVYRGFRMVDENNLRGDVLREWNRTGMLPLVFFRERPRRASFRTTRTPVGFPHAAAYLRVVNTFVLEAEGSNATRVRLVGSGYAAGAEGDALIAFFREGNRSTLQQLHKRFVSGPIAWPTQPEPTKGK